jgi:hydrogenase expression/formation protein HypC
MCLAIPTKVVEKDGDRGIVEIGGVKKQIDLTLVPEAKIGDYVILHVGFAIQVLDEEEAQKTLALFEELAQYNE